MQPGGDEWRPPRRTTCGPSIAGSRTRSGAPSPSWPTAPPTCPTRCWTAITSRWSRSRWCSATRPFAIGSSSSRRTSTAGSARLGTCPPRPSRRPRISSGCSATPGPKPTRSSPSSCPVDCRAPSPRPKPRCAPEGSAVSTWWTAGPRHWGSGCSRSAGPSWRSPAGAGRRFRGSWSGCGHGPGCCSRWTATTTCSGPAGSPAERRGWPECST